MAQNGLLAANILLGKLQERIILHNFCRISHRCRSFGYLLCLALAIVKHLAHAFHGILVLIFFHLYAFNFPRSRSLLRVIDKIP